MVAVSDEPPNRSAEMLTGLELSDGWRVVERIRSLPDGTGSAFSTPGVGGCDSTEGECGLLSGLVSGRVAKRRSSLPADEMSTERVHSQSPTKRAGCFLCEPDPSLVFARTQNFFAMLGHGPIGEGYSLIASIEHEPSILDVSSAMAREAEGFTHTVRARLAPYYGPALVTEHGRIAPCVATATEAYEPHCLHAHRLVFPGWDRLDIPVLAPEFPWRRYPSFLRARENGGPSGQYLVCQHADETIDMSQVPAQLPRQFFRSLVAAAAGRPELADWRQTRGETQIEAARRRLGLT